MATFPAPSTLDTQLRLNLMLAQLRHLEQEIILLQRTLSPTPDTSPTSFASLYGVWAGVVIDEEDFRASRLTLPEDLE